MLYALPLALICFLAFGIAGFARAAPTLSDSASTHQHTEKVSTDSAQSPSETAQEDERKGAKHTAERFVMPVTQWLEKKAHQSKVLNPTSKKVQNTFPRNDKQALRQAIVKAQKRYPGTVLSATLTGAAPDTSETDSRHPESIEFVIKILSADGIIREVRIAGSAHTDTEGNNVKPSQASE